MQHHTPSVSGSLSTDIQSTYPSLQCGKTFWDDSQFENVVKRLERGKKSVILIDIAQQVFHT